MRGALLFVLGFVASSLHGCGEGTVVEGMTAANAVPDPDKMECRLTYDTQRQVITDAKEFTILATARCAERVPSALIQRRQRRGAFAGLKGTGARLSGDAATRRKATAKPDDEEEASQVDSSELVLRNCRIQEPYDVTCPAGHHIDEKALAAWSADCVEKEVYKLGQVCVSGKPGIYADAYHDPKHLVAGTPSKHYPLDLDPKLQGKK